jgi:hypothetical protein
VAGGLSAAALLAAVLVLASPSASASACTFHVATNGDDGNPGTQAQPFLTVNRGASGLQPGETLCVRAGTYPESLYDSIPSGQSWQAPVTVKAYPGETVTIRPPSGSYRVLYFQTAQYIVVDGLILDAANVQYEAVKLDSYYGDVHHIRIANTEIMNVPGAQAVAVGVFGGGDYLNDHHEFLDLEIHDIAAYAFYISGNHNLVDGATIYRVGGYAVHVYDGACSRAEGCAAYNTVRNSRIFDVRDYFHPTGGWKEPNGIGLFTGPGNAAYNNILTGIRSSLGGYAIRAQYGAADARIYNNTVYDSGTAVYIEVPDAVVQNNILYLNVVAIDDHGAGTVKTHNLSGTDPAFVDAAGGDFRLSPGSPAIDAGTDLSAAGVTTDFEGTPRPQGAGYDIGADEYQTGGASGGLFTLLPCRLVDTRNADGPYGGPALAAGEERTFALFGRCGIPPTARALTFNITVTAPSAAGNLRLYTGGTATPLVSFLNYAAGQTRSNNAITSLSPGGALAVRAQQASGTAHLVLDVNGYFQ